MRVFISHSSRDVSLAADIAELLRAALRLSSTEIRCTSVDGYRLPAGADTDSQLRQEIVSVPVLIGLISDASIESAYVLFELGARWGTDQPLIPLLAPGMAASGLRGPLQGLNALSCAITSQLYQFVTDVGRILAISPEPPASYQRYIEKVASHPPQPLAPPHSPTAVVPLPEPTVPTHASVPAEVLATIRAEVQRRHPRNFTMQEFAEGQEINAYLRLHPSSSRAAT